MRNIAEKKKAVFATRNSQCRWTRRTLVYTNDETMLQAQIKPNYDNINIYVYQ